MRVFFYCSNFMATTFISLTAMRWRRISALERIRSANVVSTESPVWSMLSKYVWNLIFKSSGFHEMLFVWQNTVLFSEQQRYWRFHTSILMNCCRGQHHSVSDTAVTSPLHFRLLTEPRRIVWRDRDSSAIRPAPKHHYSERCESHFEKTMKCYFSLMETPLLGHAMSIFDNLTSPHDFVICI